MVFSPPTKLGEGEGAAEGQDSAEGPHAEGDAHRAAHVEQNCLRAEEDAGPDDAGDVADGGQQAQTPPQPQVRGGRDASARRHVTHDDDALAAAGVARDCGMLQLQDVMYGVA